MQSYSHSGVRSHIAEGTSHPGSQGPRHHLRSMRNGLEDKAMETREQNTKRILFTDATDDGSRKARQNSHREPPMRGILKEPHSE